VTCGCLGSVCIWTFTNIYLPAVSCHITTPCHNADDCDMSLHRRENRKSHFYCFIHPTLWLSQYSDHTGDRFAAETSIFPSTAMSIPALVPEGPSIRWVSRALSPGLKRPGREADQSPSSSAEVMEAWGYTSTPQYAFMTCAWLGRGTPYLTFSLYLLVHSLPIIVTQTVKCYVVNTILRRILKPESTEFLCPMYGLF